MNDQHRVLRHAFRVACIFMIGIAFGLVTSETPAVASTQCDWECQSTASGTSCQFTGITTPWQCMPLSGGGCVMQQCDPQIE